MVEIASGQNVRASQEPFFRSIWPDGWGETRHKWSGLLKGLYRYITLSRMQQGLRIPYLTEGDFPAGKLTRTRSKPESIASSPKLNSATEVGNIAFCLFLWIHIPCRCPHNCSAP